MARYDWPTHRYDDPSALDVSADGSRVFVTGRSNGVGTRPDYATVAYDAATGAHLWVARYNDAANAYDYARAVAVTPNGARVIVTGYTEGLVGAADRSVTIAYSAVSGAHVWLRSFQGKAGSVAYSLALSPDGSRAYVTGTRVGVNLPVTTVAYDARHGAREWVARYDRNGQLPTFTSVSPDGSRVYVSARDATAAFDASSGGKLWADRPALDSVIGMALPGDGSHVYVAGTSSGNMDAVAYDPISGARDWTSTFGVPGTSLSATSVVTSPDGAKVLVTGYCVVGGNTDFVTVAFSTA